MEEHIMRNRSWRLSEAERYEIARKSLHQPLREIAEAHNVHVRTVTRCLARVEIVDYVEEPKPVSYTHLTLPTICSV